MKSICTTIPHKHRDFEHIVLHYSADNSLLGIGLYLKFDLHFNTNKMDYSPPFNSKVDYFYIGGSGAHFDPPDRGGSRGRKIPTPWNFIIEVLNNLFKQ